MSATPSLGGSAAREFAIQLALWGSSHGHHRATEPVDVKGWQDALGVYRPHLSEVVAPASLTMDAWYEALLPLLGPDRIRDVPWFPAARFTLEDACTVASVHPDYVPADTRAVSTGHSLYDPADPAGAAGPAGRRLRLARSLQSMPVLGMTSEDVGRLWAQVAKNAPEGEFWADMPVITDRIRAWDLVLGPDAALYAAAGYTLTQAHAARTHPDPTHRVTRGQLAVLAGLTR